ncbi:MAG: hypothetical protein ACI8PP_001998 [Candidatus Pseudothioglobus sp.]|jgi:hypothetical protein
MRDGFRRVTMEDLATSAGKLWEQRKGTERLAQSKTGGLFMAWLT